MEAQKRQQAQLELADAWMDQVLLESVQSGTIEKPMGLGAYSTQLWSAATAVPVLSH